MSLSTRNFIAGGFVLAALIALAVAALAESDTREHDRENRSTLARAEAMADEIEALHAEIQASTVQLTVPGTATILTPGSLPSEPRELTDEERAAMETVRPDTSLPWPTTE
ncbi:MAG: hypothetical protein D6E12_18225 [Desulfovibrio sp.]|nr:MAG: hypothetical protein D6E12_18225 [Desulfovibrio sp.]